MKEQNKPKNEEAFPLIPDKLYFSIGETAALCDIKPHVLRYWEQEFQQLTPIKRRGNRRYYQRKDILLVCTIKSLLYGQGFTIEGARAKLQAAASLDTTAPAAATAPETVKRLNTLLAELDAIAEELDKQK